MSGPSMLEPHGRDNHNDGYWEFFPLSDCCGTLIHPEENDTIWIDDKTPMHRECIALAIGDVVYDLLGLTTIPQEEK